MYSNISYIYVKLLKYWNLLICQIVKILKFYSSCCLNFIFLFPFHSQGKGTKLRGALTKVVTNSPRTAGKSQENLTLKCCKVLWTQILVKSKSQFFTLLSNNASIMILSLLSLKVGDMNLGPCSGVLFDWNHEIDTKQQWIFTM